MKLKVLFASLLAVALIGALPNTASATPILIGVNTPFVPASDGQATIEAWLAAVVTSYNLANGTTLPAPGSEIFRVNAPGSPNTGIVPAGYPSFPVGALSITLPTDGFQYLIFHWGGNQQVNITHQAFYVGGEAPGSTFAFNAPGQFGLSYYDGFGAREVPEPTSIMLIGMGLIGLAVGAKRRLL